jgi:undecaprenyl-diphosphatase
MNILDEPVIFFLNKLAADWGIVNSIMFLIVENTLIKGGAVIAVIWYLWFQKNDPNVHLKIISCFLACIVAIIVGRGLALSLPFRARPILNPEFDFSYTADKLPWVNTWSSFPSDHAVLFFSLATGIYFISKVWGLATFSYIAIVICFPRIYLGLHYPTDILTGALVGIFISWLISRLKTTKKLSKKIMKFANKYPGIFYVCFFLITYQIATLFEDSQAIIRFIVIYGQKVVNLIV